MSNSSSARDQEHVVVHGAHRLVAHAHGEHGRERRRGREQARRHLDSVADNHLHGECLAERARHPQDDRRHKRRGGRAQNHVPHRLPASAAKCIGTFTILIRHRSERIDREARDRGENHHGEHDCTREDAETGDGLTCRCSHIAGPRDHDGEADQAVNDRRDSHQKLDERLEHATPEPGGDLNDEDRRADGNRQGEQRREQRDCERTRNHRQRTYRRHAVHVVLMGIPRGAGEEYAQVDAINGKCRDTSAARPLATSVTTRSATSAMHAPVTPLPISSTRCFGN